MAGIGRIYTNQSVVGAGLNGLYEGLKDAEDEKFRNAEQTMKAEQFAAERYLKARRNKAGGYGGLDIDEEKIDRDTPIAESKYPGFFSKVTQAATPESFGKESDLRARAMQDLAPQTPPASAPPPAPAPQPIQPLLKSKESSRQESDMAMAKGDQEVKAKIAEGNKPVSLGKEQYTGTEAGVDKFEQPVNTKVSFDEGMTYAAPKEEVKERFRPSNIAMTNIMGGLSNKDATSDPQINLATLDPEVKKLMGLSPDAQGNMQTSMANKLIEAGSKRGAVQNTGVRPEVQEQIDAVMAGETTPAAVFRTFPDLNKTEVSYVNRAAMAALGQKKSERDFNYKEKQGNRLSPNELIKVQDGYQAFQVADSLDQAIEKNIDIFGPVKGRVGGVNPYDERAQSVNAILYEAKQLIGKFMEGGVLRAEDEKKYEKMLPQLSDQPEVARAKLQGIRKMLSDKAKGYRDVLQKGGYDASPFDELVAQGLPTQVTEGGGSKSAPGGAGAGVDKIGKSILGDKKPKSDGSANADLRRARALLYDYRGIIMRRMNSEKKSADWASKEIDKKKAELNQYFRNTHGQDFQE